MIDNTSIINEQDNILFKKVALIDDKYQKKTMIQNYAVEFSKKDKHIVLSWATGCGKSLAALKIIKDAVDSGKTTPWFIVCSQVSHIENWISEIVKHKLGYLMEYIEIFCYASLEKYINKKANIILDESHSVSDLRLDKLRTIKADKIISLSATLNYDRKKQLSSLSKFREFDITMTDAINMGILPPPKIYVIYDNLDKVTPDQIYNKTKQASNKDCISLDVHYNNYFQTLMEHKDTKSYKMKVYCNEQQYYDLITNEIEYDKKMYSKKISPYSHLRKVSLKTLSLGKRRKNFISNTKTTVLKNLVGFLDSFKYRYIGFVGTVEQSHLLSMENSINSYNGNKKNANIIQRFNEKKIDSIFAVKMLREGQNLEDIEAGIITQLDSEDLSFIQMMGRVFRSTNPILFVIVKNNTQDIVYLKKCIDKLDTKYITYIENTPENMINLKNMLCQEKLKKTQELQKELK